jgi:hypothetical protein
MNPTSRISVALAVLISLSGCAELFKYRPYARKVEVESGKGGVIALKQNNRMEDQQLARSLMAQNCGQKRAVIVKEGEVVTGTKTLGSKRKDSDLYGRNKYSYLSNSQRERSETETITKKEWQIHYKCK